MSDMSEEKEQLLKLLVALRDSHAAIVEAINNFIKSMAPPEVKGEIVKPTLTTERVEQLFPEELRKLLNFEQTASGWKITPRQYLGSENFAKVADIVRKAGGDYVSAGKSSHFLIPFKR